MQKVIENMVEIKGGGGEGEMKVNYDWSVGGHIFVS